MSFKIVECRMVWKTFSELWDSRMKINNRLFPWFNNQSQTVDNFRPIELTLCFAKQYKVNTDACQRISGWGQGNVNVDGRWKTASLGWETTEDKGLRSEVGFDLWLLISDIRHPSSLVHRPSSLALRSDLPWLRPLNPEPRTAQPIYIQLCQRKSLKNSIFLFWFLLWSFILMPTICNMKRRSHESFTAIPFFPRYLLEFQTLA